MINKEISPQIKPRRVLVICTGNSCRSQMAQGLINHDLAGSWIADSAGVIASGVNPRAIQVMAELEIDISHHTSKTIDVVLNNPYDLVVTVCDHARDMCPVFPRAVASHHMGFEDPVYATNLPKEIALPVFRRIRDRIREQLIPFLRNYPHNEKS
jgi:arsenate reductase